MDGPLALFIRELGLYFTVVWAGAAVLAGTVAGLGALPANRTRHGEGTPAAPAPSTSPQA